MKAAMGICSVVEYIRQRNGRDADYRYNPNELYDYLVRRLFRDRLHKDDEYHILFARREHFCHPSRKAKP